MTRTHIASFASLLLLASACSGGDVTGVGVRAVTSDQQPADTPEALADDGGTQYTLVEAWLHLRHIELDLPDGLRCADIEADLAGGAYCEPDDSSGGDTIAIDGPLVVDLIDGSTTPGLDAVTVPALAYERIDFRVDDGDPQEGVVQPGSALDDTSFVVTAVFDYRGDTTELDLSLNFDEDIRIERPGGVALDGDEDLVAEFVVDDWLAGADIPACIEDGDITVSSGVVTIDDENDGSCGGIENTVKLNMKESGQL